MITCYTRRFLSPLCGLLVGLILVVTAPFPVSATSTSFAPPPPATIQVMIGLLNSGTCAQVYDATAPLPHRSLTRVAAVRACNRSRSAMRGTGLIIRYAAMGRGMWASVAAPDYRGRAYDQPVTARVSSCGRSQRYQWIMQLVPIAGRWYLHGVGRTGPGGAVQGQWLALCPRQK
ncbi:MAG: hypothetical protein M3Y74_21495 [Chloroflexota bacterium]|nr:hypothetical protein [Chloroflexota bacterium]